MSLYAVKQRGFVTELNFYITDTKLAFANIILLAHRLKGKAYYQGASTELAVIFIKEDNQMENEIRYYLKQIKKAIEGEEGFKPSYIVTAVKLPTGAIELAVNNSGIVEKIDYILEAYDDDMRLKTNTEVQMQNLMIV